MNPYNLTLTQILLTLTGLFIGLTSWWTLTKKYKETWITPRYHLLSPLIIAISFPSIILSGSQRSILGTYIFYSLMLITPFIDKIITKRNWKEYGFKKDSLPSDLLLGLGFGLAGLVGALFKEPSWTITKEFILYNMFFFIPAEEIYFRGFIQPVTQSKLNKNLSNLIQATLFSLAFYAWGYNLKKTFLVFAAGVIEGEIYNKTHSVFCTYVTQTAGDILPSIIIYNILKVNL